MVIGDKVTHAAEAMNETLIPAQTHLEFTHTHNKLNLNEIHCFRFKWEKKNLDSRYTFHYKSFSVVTHIIKYKFSTLSHTFKGEILDINVFEINIIYILKIKVSKITLTHYHLKIWGNIILMFLKEVSYVHQGCIYLIKIHQKQE